MLVEELRVRRADTRVFGNAGDEKKPFYGASVKFFKNLNRSLFSDLEEFKKKKKKAIYGVTVFFFGVVVFLLCTNQR